MTEPRTFRRRDLLRAAAVLPLAAALPATAADGGAFYFNLPGVDGPPPVARLEVDGSLLADVGEFRLAWSYTRMRRGAHGLIAYDTVGESYDPGTIATMPPGRPSLSGVAHFDRLVMRRRDATAFYEQFGVVRNAARNNLRLRGVDADWRVDLRNVVLTGIERVEALPGDRVRCAGVDAILCVVERIY